MNAQNSGFPVNPYIYCMAIKIEWNTMTTMFLSLTKIQIQHSHNILTNTIQKAKQYQSSKIKGTYVGDLSLHDADSKTIT